MQLRAGSWPWLLAHELRLVWRHLGDRGGHGSTAFGVMLCVLAVLWIGLHAFAWAVMGTLSLESLGPLGVPIAGAVCLLVLSLVLAIAVVNAIGALFDRGDLDLLLSAPIPSERVFIVRGLGVAVSSVGVVALVVGPFVHMGIVRGRWEVLLAYPVLAGVGLGAAGFGLGLTLFLVRRLGARRARVLAQLLSALIGASFVLGFQIPNLMRGDDRGQFMTDVTALVTDGWLAADSVLWWPLRALLGDVLPAAAVIAAGAALFVAVVRLTRATFLTGAQQAAAVTAPVRARATAVAFRPGIVRNFLVKELKLIGRDPNLIAQTLLQTLYIVPMLFLVSRQAQFFSLLGPVFIVMLAQVAGNLAWITVSGEEAPELVGSAPVNARKVLWLKAAAALIPPAAVGLPLALLYLTRTPANAIIFAAYLALALGAAAVTQIWASKPAPQRDLKQRYKQNVLINTIEMFSVLGVAGACFLTMAGSWWALAALAVGAIAPACAYATRSAERA